MTDDATLQARLADALTEQLRLIEQLSRAHRELAQLRDTRSVDEQVADLRRRLDESERQAGHWQARAFYASWVIKAARALVGAEPGDPLAWEAVRHALGNHDRMARTPTESVLPASTGQTFAEVNTRGEG